MSTFTCPNGHASTSSDYCDTCGAPIAEGAAAAPPATAAPAATAAPDSSGTPDAGPASSAPTPEVCPNCGADHDAAALFCEACGYDFTTGTMPRPPDAATGSTETGAAEAGSGTATPDAEDQVSVAPALEADWVAEVWVDPDWYEAQESEDPCPSPGLPAVVVLSTRSVLVGRPSKSRNIHPEIDCTGDPGVSRRQAQLTTDGRRWWVEDLQSSNGTYVGPASGPLPTDPVPPGQRRELSEDDRVYVGAWTRIVVRRATPEERGR